MNIQRGFRDKLEKYINVSTEMIVEMQVSGQAVYDYCCFGVDAAGKLSDDRYMVFYNQTQSPQREITYTASGQRACFTVNLNRLPASVQKLVFTVSIDGGGTMGQISSHTVQLIQNGKPNVEMVLSGKDFQAEKAIISIEIYRKDVWRFAAVARGFNGGLGDLLRSYGGEETTSPSSTPSSISIGMSAQQTGYPTANPALGGMPEQQSGYPTANPALGGRPAQPSGYPTANPALGGMPEQQSGYPTANPALGGMPEQQPYYQTAQGYANNTAQPYNGAVNPAVPAPNAAQGASPQKQKGGFFSSLFGGKKKDKNNPTGQTAMPPNAYPTGQTAMPPNAYPTGNTAMPPNAYPTGNTAMPPAASSKKKVSLEKKLQQEAPQLVSLAKPLELELEKHHLQDCVARVALVLDISGSMSSRYSDGTVQEIVNKTLPLAVQFDDDGELDFWYYGSRPKRMPSVNLKNYTSAVPAQWRDLMSGLGYGNNEPKVMNEVLAEYRHSRLPAYVLFVTDGGVGSESAIKQILIEASREPIFWQFVGVGGSGYGVLERLDNMTGRYVDNANFFALDDFKKVSNEELYSRLLNEFPGWLNEIKRRKMIKGS